MDYIDGESLSDIVKRDGPMPEAKAIKYIRKIGDALDYIHSRRMTHFDVKPANIMMRKSDGNPILIDFGLSKQYDKQGDATSTLMQAVSNGFSPIELYNTGSVNTFSPQTDIYSLGATLYYLIVGQAPPDALTLFESGLNIPISLSETTKDAIRNAMETSRSKRTKSIKDFQLILQAPLTQSLTNIMTSSEEENNENISMGYVNYDTLDEVEEDTRSGYSKFLDAICGDRQWARDLISSILLVILACSIILCFIY